MKFPNSNWLRSAVLWIAPMALLSAPAAHAQWAQAYGYYDDYGHARRDHKLDEKRDLKEHQREERWYYGNSRALRQHQKEERHELKHHQQRERRYDDFNRGRDGYSRRGWYDGRRY